MIPEGFNCMPPVRRQMELPEDKARGSRMSAGVPYPKEDELKALSWFIVQGLGLQGCTHLLRGPGTG